MHIAFRLILSVALVAGRCLHVQSQDVYTVRTKDLLAPIPQTLWGIFFEDIGAAPLFAHVTGWQWTPDLIWFDNARSYRTPNYFVQQLFSINKGSAAVPLLKEGRAITGQDSCWASAVIDQNTHELIIKLVNLKKDPREKDIELADARVQGRATVTTLGDSRLGTANSLDRESIVPVATTIPVKGRRLTVMVAPYSLTVLRVHFE
jgi:alpha-N-arabinofuranosidase